MSAFSVSDEVLTEAGSHEEMLIKRHIKKTANTEGKIDTRLSWEGKSLFWRVLLQMTTVITRSLLTQFFFILYLTIRQHWPHKCNYPLHFSTSKQCIIMHFNACQSGPRLAISTVLNTVAALYCLLQYTAHKAVGTEIAWILPFCYKIK